MPMTGLPARRAALRIVNAVTIQHRSLAEMGDDLVAELPPGERARALRLATSCLRHAPNADRLLGRHLKKMPSPDVMNLLRLGVVEICQEAEAAHGVVNACVELAQSRAETRRQKGLVNAVLRRIAAEDVHRWPDLPPPKLPGWLRKMLVRSYGQATVRAIEAAHAAGAPIDLTVRGDGAAWAERLNGVLLPTGSVRLRENVQVSALPGFEEGAWWVQDAAAALPALALAARPGEVVADLCAAPGGKALQLAATGAEVTAVDISGKRLERLKENLARTGLQARVIEADALEFNDGPFDAMLLDAPCSATGTIRRHPDLPYVKDAAVLHELVPLQARLLDHALKLLRPEGRLVFCTCSLLREEGEDQVSAALHRHPGLAVDGAALELPGTDAEWRQETGLRTRPDHWAELGGIDGFFITVLRKLA